MLRKSIHFLAISFAFSIPFYLFAQSLTNAEVQLMANKMLLSAKYKVTVKKVLPTINNIQVALLSLPYREFPAIIIIKKNITTKKWHRVFECFSPGIQDKSSGLLDWHTQGTGVDFEIGKIKLYHFDDKKVRVMMNSTLTSLGGIIVPYQNFIHMNTGKNPVPPGFAPYTIDKTRYFDLANDLSDGSYKTYPKDQCIMFDSPKVIDCEFFILDNSFVIKAFTDNHQTWIYTFDGIDDQNLYLLNKNIIVKTN